MLRRLSPLVIAAALAVALVGCTGTPAPETPSTSAGTQSVAEACAAVGDAVGDAVTRFQEVDPTDPAASAEALAGMAAGLEAAADAVSNADVAAIVDPLTTAVASAAEIMTAIAAGDLTRVPQLQGPATEIQQSFTRFAELCAAD